MSVYVCLSLSVHFVCSLDDDVASYGRQRMFGSFGWAIAMLFVGAKSFNYYVTNYYVINYRRLPLPE